MSSDREPELVLEGGAPFDRQIRDQIRRLVAAGVLHPGEQLPTVRAAAVGLAVNPRVVLRAYAELEREGVVRTEQGSGIFVAPPAPSPEAERRAALERLCLEFLARAAGRGFSPADVTRAIQALTDRRLPP
jgi:GntR family transcriptional regulator